MAKRTCVDRARAPAAFFELVEDVFHGRGRKRKLGARSPSGRLRPAPRISREHVARSMPHRKGLGDSAVSHLAENEFGRMLLAGHISSEQYVAGNYYNRCWRNYIGTLGGPRRLGHAASRRGNNCGQCEPDSCACKKAAAEFLAADNVLMREGQAVKHAVMHVVVFDQAPDSDRVPLIIGLNALAWYFGLTKGEAAESGDWMSAENKAASALRKSGARLRQARAARDEPEVIGRFEGLAPDAPEPADMSEDDVQEYRDDGPAPEDEPDILPDDAQEKALAPPPEPSPLVRSPRRVVEELARRAAQAEQRELERRFEAERQKYRALADEAGVPQYNWVEIDWQWQDNLDGRLWARISKPPGPPRDPPPERDSGWSPPSRDALWKYEHRGFMTSFAGARSPGRPKKTNKLTRAEIQKAYRDRQCAREPK